MYVFTDCGLIQVVNESTETVYCVKDAAARLRQQHKSFTPHNYQLLYRLDDVSLCHCIYRNKFI